MSQRHGLKVDELSLNPNNLNLHQLFHFLVISQEMSSILTFILKDQSNYLWQPLLKINSPFNPKIWCRQHQHPKINSSMGIIPRTEDVIIGMIVPHSNKT